MFPSLTSRQRQPEWMDAPDADPDDLRRSLAFIRTINRLLGYTRTTIGHLERFSRGWTRGQTVRILDVGTGSGDIPRAILRWAQRKGFDVRIVGVDLHAATARAAADDAGDRRLSIIQGDALRLPFANESFDYVLTAMFLHHLDDAAAVRVLQELSRTARRGIIAADLLRHRRARAWISLFTLFANPMVRHDARVSVAQAFNKEEVLQLREQAGIEYARYYRHFGHRFVLAGEK